MGEKATATATNSGIGFTGALFLVFLVLKLLGKITWSWWWVTAPLWGGLAIVLGLLAIAGALLGLVFLVLKVSEKVRARR